MVRQGTAPLGGDSCQASLRAPVGGAVLQPTGAAGSEEIWLVLEQVHLPGFFPWFVFFKFFHLFCSPDLTLAPPTPSHPPLCPVVARLPCGVVSLREEDSGDGEGASGELHVLEGLQALFSVHVAVSTLQASVQQWIGSVVFSFLSELRVLGPRKNQNINTFTK